MAKRGESGLSLVLGVSKPQGLSSHDVVNRVRRIFGERRVGHTGTLDPFASGVLCVCVGPAARLDAYLTGHDKSYRVRIAFGFATTTDDIDGEPTRFGAVPTELYDEAFARETLARFIGPQKQLPPAYSAIKVGGVKACDAARAGRIIELAPRDVEVFGLELLGIVEAQGDAPLFWDVMAHVSKGTYIRSLARDIGHVMKCPAHVAALERTSAGPIALADCASLEALESLGARAALDPVKLLGFRFSYVDGEQALQVQNGATLPQERVRLFEWRRGVAQAELCACTSGVCESVDAPGDGETVSLIANNQLVALYCYDQARAVYKPSCVFHTGVLRGQVL